MGGIASEVGGLGRCLGQGGGWGVAEEETKVKRGSELGSGAEERGYREQYKGI